MENKAFDSETYLKKKQLQNESLLITSIFDHLKTAPETNQLAMLEVLSPHLFGAIARPFQFNCSYSKESKPLTEQEKVSRTLFPSDRNLVPDTISVASTLTPPISSSGSLATNLDESSATASENTYVPIGLKPVGGPVVLAHANIASGGNNFEHVQRPGTKTSERSDSFAQVPPSGLKPICVGKVNTIISEECDDITESSEQSLKRSVELEVDPSDPPASNAVRSKVNDSSRLITSLPDLREYCLDDSSVTSNNIYNNNPPPGK